MADALLCAKCHQPPATDVTLRVTPGKPKTAADKGCFGCLGCLGLIVVLFIAGSMVGSHGGGSAESTTAATAAPEAQAPVETPTPKPNRHDDRQKVQDWWGHAIANLGLAEASVTFAAQAIGEGDSVTASGLLKRAQEFADAGETAARENVPDGWDDISSSLGSDEASYRDIIQRMRSILDDPSASKMADLKDDFESASAHAQATVHDARVKYVGMGGAGSDLSDGSRERQGVLDLWKALNSSK